MCLELNFNDSQKFEDDFENQIWDNVNLETLQDFCLVNNCGSVTAFKIKFDYYLNFRQEEAIKTFKMFSVFCQSLEDKNESTNLILEKGREILTKILGDNKAYSKVNLNVFKIQSNKRIKLNKITKIKQNKNKPTN